MEMPFSSAAKRHEVFIDVTITVALPLPPHCSMYLREIGPLSAREPAKARPKPSRMDFLPSSMTSAGIFSYLVCRTNCPTYRVSPGVFGKSLTETAFAASARAASEGAASTAAPISPKDVLPNSRLRIIHLKAAHATAEPRRRGLPRPYLHDEAHRDNSDSTRAPKRRSSRGMRLEFWRGARSGRHLFAGIR